MPQYCYGIMNKNTYMRPQVFFSENLALRPNYTLIVETIWGLSGWDARGQSKQPLQNRVPWCIHSL